MKETKKSKWRGIQTTQRKINEKQAVTIRNRFDQLSLSLPRIDDKKRWAGFPGVTGISRKVVSLIPPCKKYVEPFAGTAKVYQEMIKQKRIEPGISVLNDKACYIVDWLKTNFSNELITDVDFIDCMQYWDSIETFFFIDLPWFKGSYDQKFAHFDRKDVNEYDKEVIASCKKLSASFIISTRKENYHMLQSGFNNYLIQSEYKVCGKLPEVLLTTNLRLDGLKEVKKD